MTRTVAEILRAAADLVETSGNELYAGILMNEEEELFADWVWNHGLWCISEFVSANSPAEVVAALRAAADAWDMRDRKRRESLPGAAGFIVNREVENG